jgi:uncharacterized protein (TIGR03435 family)
MVKEITLALFTSYGAFGQTAPSPLAFEVVSVRPNISDERTTKFNTRNGSLNSTNVSLREFIRWAYGVKDYQIAGPDWLRSQRYDIVAKAEASVPDDRLMAMLQGLLAERFKLAIHRETKERAVYALVVGKNGPRLHEVEAGPQRSLNKRNYCIAREKGLTSVRIENSKYLCSPAESEHPNVPILVLDYLSKRPEARLCHADSMPAGLGLS